MYLGLTLSLYSSILNKHHRHRKGRVFMDAAQKKTLVVKGEEIDKDIVSRIIRLELVESGIIKPNNVLKEKTLLIIRKLFEGFKD